MVVVFMKQNDETKPLLVKKEEPDTVEPKQESMETEEKKPEVKAEPKEEESGANGTSATSTTQNRKKGKLFMCLHFGGACLSAFVQLAWNSTFIFAYTGMCFVSWLSIIVFHPVFKPEELRQALMPTLEALYRQDPESLPFRQPVNPMLLGIPVSAGGRTHPYHNQDFTQPS